VTLLCKLVRESLVINVSFSLIVQKLIIGAANVMLER